MSYAEPRLVKIAEGLRAGEPSPSITVRMFIWWFFAERRGYRIVQQIRRQLKNTGLRTVPNFEHAWIDAPITFELLEAEKENTAEEASDDAGVPVTESTDVEAATPIWVSKEATYRISRLAAANQSVVSANPDEPLASVITKMMAGGSRSCL